MADNREISKKEKQIIKDIMSRSNYGEEKASKIAKEMIDFGYTIHEQDYFKLKNAIKITINKDVCETLLKNTKTFDGYNQIIRQLGCFDELTQEEYELLKEIF